MQGDDGASTFPVTDGKDETLQKEQEKIAELYSSIVSSGERSTPKNKPDVQGYASGYTR